MDRTQVWRYLNGRTHVPGPVAAAVAWAWLLSPLGGYLAICLEAVGIRMTGLLTNADTATASLI